MTRVHFKNTSQGNFANGQCLLIENLITLCMGLIAELMSPFIYPFILHVAAQYGGAAETSAVTLAIITVFTVLHVNETDL